MKRRDFLVGGVPLLGAIGVTLHKLIPSARSNNVIVTVGTTEQGGPMWPAFVAAAQKRGIQVNTRGFSAYPPVNPALSQKLTDVNLFQHLRYLAEYIVASNDVLVPVGSTEIVPLCIYSKHASVAAIPAGGTVVIPNDPTNLGRGLYLLRSAGLVDFPGQPISPTLANVLPSSKVKVLTVDAAQTARNIQTTDGAVVNNNFVDKAGIDPKSAIFSDNPNDPAAAQYINIFVARPGDQNNPHYQALVDAWHDPSVLVQVQKESKGTSVEVKKPQHELQLILDDIVKRLRSS